jgi:hypothetical protein
VQGLAVVQLTGPSIWEHGRNDWLYRCEAKIGRPRIPIYSPPFWLWSKRLGTCSKMNDGCSCVGQDSEVGTARARSRSSDAFGDLWSESPEMSRIPCVDNLGTGLQGAPGQHKIINCTSWYASLSGLLQGAVVFLCVQNDNREFLLDVLEQEQNLFAT